MTVSDIQFQLEWWVDNKEYGMNVTAQSEVVIDIPGVGRFPIDTFRYDPDGTVVIIAEQPETQGEG